MRNLFSGVYRLMQFLGACTHIVMIFIPLVIKK